MVRMEVGRLLVIHDTPRICIGMGGGINELFGRSQHTERLYTGNHEMALFAAFPQRCP